MTKVRTHEDFSRKNSSGLSRLLRTVVCALGTGGGALVAGVARDTHDCELCKTKRRLAICLLFLISNHPRRERERRQRRRTEAASNDDAKARPRPAEPDAQTQPGARDRFGYRNRSEPRSPNWNRGSRRMLLACGNRRARALSLSLSVSCLRRGGMSKRCCLT